MVRFDDGSHLVIRGEKTLDEERAAGLRTAFLDDVFDDLLLELEDASTCL